MFIGPLVYNPQAANWEDAIGTISQFANLWLPKY
jgi:hypothetical protein